MACRDKGVIALIKKMALIKIMTTHLVAVAEPPAPAVAPRVERVVSRREGEGVVVTRSYCTHLRGEMNSSARRGLFD